MANQSGPKITVVTVNLNNSKGLARTLASIANQDHPDIQSIIIDGASSDDSLEVIGRLKLDNADIVSEPDLGPYDAMNKGVARASGEIIQFLNSGDSYSHNQVLSRVASCFSELDVELVYGNTHYFDESDRIVRHWRSGDFKSWKVYLGWMPNHSSSFAKTTLFRRTDPFRTDFKIASDYEMFLRWFQINGVKPLYCAEVITCMEIGGISNSSLGNIWMASREVRRAWRDNGLPYGWAAPFTKILMKVPQLFGMSAKLDDSWSE